MAASSNAVQAVAQLRSMFSNADPRYLDAAVQCYPSDWPVDKLVSRVSGKLLEANHGHYPTVLFRGLSRYSTVSSPPKQSRKVSFGKSFKGKGRVSTPGDIGTSASILQVDETASRNVALMQLNETYPSIDLAHLRDVLLESEHSYIYEALAVLQKDASLAPDSTHMLRRTLRNDGGGPKRQHLGEMGRADLIRDSEYVESALQLLCAQFPNLWKTSIKAVMAEHNWDYFTSVQAVRRLEDERTGSLFTKAWSAFAQAFVGPSRLQQLPTDFSIHGYLMGIGSTSEMSPTLLYELHLHLSSTRPRPPPEQHLPNAPSNDTIECGCCFSDVYFSEAASCASGCLFCKTCLNRAVEETVFGQAPLTLYRPEAKEGDFGAGMGIRCLSIEGCQAAFTDKELARTLSETTHHALEKKVAQEVLQLSVLPKLGDGKRRLGIKIVECPFCNYAEMQEVPQLSWIYKVGRIFPGFLILLSLYYVWFVAALIWSELLNTPRGTHDGSAAQLPSSTGPRLYVIIDPTQSVREIQSRLQHIFQICWTKGSSGTVFRCRNSPPISVKAPSSTTFASPAYIHSLLPPAPVSGKETDFATRYCGRASCLLCCKLWYPGHKCSDSVEGLRLAMETAASNAVKRQCPECGLSFVKSDGCNKISCRCGYIMCFICRKGIGSEGYSHFCQHPREPGQRCTVCVKCDLFKTDDDGKAAKVAAELARQEWLNANPELGKNAKTPVVKTIKQDIDGTATVLEQLELATARCFAFLLSLQ